MWIRKRRRFPTKTVSSLWKLYSTRTHQRNKNAKKRYRAGYCQGNKTPREGCSSTLGITYYGKMDQVSTTFRRELNLLQIFRTVVTWKNSAEDEKFEFHFLKSQLSVLEHNFKNLQKTCKEKQEKEHRASHHDGLEKQRQNRSPWLSQRPDHATGVRKHSGLAK